MRHFAILGFVLCISAGCSVAEPMEASCLNTFASADYGEVRAIPGGFEVVGSGPKYTTLAITQTAFPMRPGTAGIPADDYPKPYMRTFACEPVHD